MSVNLKRPTHQSELTDWEVESIPALVGGAKTITVHTRQLIVERSTPFFRVLSFLNKLLLVLSTLALIGLAAASVAITISLLDNLSVVHAVQSQHNITAVK